MISRTTAQTTPIVDMPATAILDDDMINPDDLLFGALFFLQNYDSRASRSIRNIVEAPEPERRRSHRGRPREAQCGSFEDLADGSLFRPEDDRGSALEPERASPISHMTLVGAL
jgi:hypothetical protein